MFSSSSLLLLLFVIVSVFGSVYQYTGNPYQDGFDPDLQVTSFIIKKGEDGLKDHTVVYTPKVAGNYATLFFIGGLGGIVPSEVYSRVLKRVASHGFVIAGVDHLIGGVFPPVAEEDLSWLQEHLQSRLDDKVPGVTASWDHIGLGGHSDGAQSVLEMVMKDPAVANATLFLEGGWLKDVKHVNFTHPAFIYGTQDAPRHSTILSQCGEYLQPDELYDAWNCPRVVMNATDFGHCDILDEYAWEGCHFSDFCYTNKTNNRDQYRVFAQGIMSAFLIRYVQGVADATKYFTNSDFFNGVKVTHFRTDLQC